MPWSAINQTAFEWLSLSGQPSATVEAVKALAQWPIFALPVLVACLWLFGQRSDREAAVEAAIAALLAMVVAHLASVVIDHPRPFMLGLAPNILDHAPDSSFPSDHATLFFALARSFGSRRWPRLRWLGIALSAAGLAVGAARVALGVHFPFDILGAAVIGTGCAAIVGMRVWRRPLALVMAMAEALRKALLGRRFGDRRQGPVLSRDDARPAG